MPAVPMEARLMVERSELPTCSSSTKILVELPVGARCVYSRIRGWRKAPADIWKSQAEITRTKDQAMSIILAHESRIRSGQSSLGQLAMSESDCSSARKMGDLGFFGRGDMQKEFEDASFKLKPGEVSGVVETASGLHLIER